MKYLVLLLTLTLGLNSFAQPDCKSFKNGKFKIVDPEVGTSYIERKGSKQLEYGESSKLRLEFQVKWIDQCTYTLKLDRILENPDGIEFPKDMVVTVEILSTSDDSYRQRSTSDLYDISIETEVIRID